MGFFSNLFGRDRRSSTAIVEPWAGAWQAHYMGNESVTPPELYPAAYACITLIANDISKLPVLLTKKDENGIWQETSNPAYDAVLRRPNKYQTRQSFVFAYVASLLSSGSVTVLLVRDKRNVVREMHVLSPDRVKPMVSPSGEIAYELQSDDIAGIGENVLVPSSEVVRDVLNPLWHPLCGVSPLAAAAMPVGTGQAIMLESARFFKNKARPSGILTVPGAIDDETVAVMKASWQEAYSGDQAGRVAVLADGLTYSAIDSVAYADAELVAQLGFTAHQICAVFGVPGFMIGLDSAPNKLGNVEAQTLQYYSQTLQAKIESAEASLAYGLGLAKDLKLEFDLDALLKMDSHTLVETLAVAVQHGILAPDEARKKLGYGPVPGGSSPLAQVQNYSLAALAKRDSRLDPFAADDDADPEITEDVKRIVSSLNASKLRETIVHK